MSHVLDRPVWTALAGRQARLGVGDEQARRFRPEINLFGAAVDRSAAAHAALGALADQGLGTVEPEPLRTIPGLTLLKAALVNQMVAETSPGLGDLDPVPLGEADAAEMLALATLTAPGPFVAETWRMGRFIGVREGGRLIAMAGERMRAPGFTEVSGVCTHPYARGRGLAGGLMRAVIDRIVAEGDAAFLHVYPDNHGAIGLYEALGFRFRAQLHFEVWEPSPRPAPSAGTKSPAPRAE